MSVSADTRTSTKTGKELGTGIQSKRTTINTIMTGSTKVASQESLIFGEKEGESLPEMTEADYKNRSLLTALELAAIFEDCVDTLSALSSAVAAPSLEIRTASSIMEDEFFNRPRFGGKFKSLGGTPPVQPKTKFTTAVFQPVLPPISLDRTPTHPIGSRRESELKEQGGESREEPAISERGSQRKEKISFNSGRAEESSGKTEGSSRKIDGSTGKAEGGTGKAEAVTDKAAGGTGRTAGSSKTPPSSPRGEDTSASSRVRTDTQQTEEEEDEGEEEKEEGKGVEWMIQQKYMAKVYKRTWQGNKQTPTRTFEDMIKTSGLKRSNPVHKMQADTGAIKVMMSDIFTELCQKGTFDSLELYLEQERHELNSLPEAAKRLLKKRQYAKKLKADIIETRQSKKTDLQMLKLMEHQIEDDGQEIRMRTCVETSYTKNYVEAKCQQSLKRSDVTPAQTKKEIGNLRKWLVIEDKAHMTMKEYLQQRILETHQKLEYWVDKYDFDKERLMADLDELKEERAAKAAHRADLEGKLRLWMPIIKDDRRLRRDEEAKMEHLRREMRAATKVAARWKGYMVRAGIGRFARKLH